MPKYPDNFENFHRLHKNKQAKTVAGLIAGFVIFFGGIIYLTSTPSVAPKEVEHGSASPMPDELMPPPQEIAEVQSPTSPVAEQQLQPAMTPVEQPKPETWTQEIVKKAKKISKHKRSKKIAKSKKKDNLVCIPPSRLKALEKQVARASRR